MTDAADALRVLRLCRPARPAELRGIRRAVESWARRAGLAADLVVDLQLALGEAVANGVEHAYADADGTVEVELELCGSGVAVRVADHGRWRPVPAHSGYRGRGLAMIERLARAVRVHAGDHGTEVRFAIPASPIAPA